MPIYCVAHLTSYTHTYGMYVCYVCVFYKYGGLTIFFFSLRLDPHLAIYNMCHVHLSL